MKPTTFLLSSLLTVTSSVVLAEMKQHDSHEHGAAVITVATNESGLEITLESPAANVFGFEYKPTSPADIKTAKQAVEKLEAGSELFSINSTAKCTLKSADVDSVVSEDDHESEDKHDDHDEHKSDDKHDDLKESAHSDVDATWQFACANPKAINSLEINLFSAFPKGFEEIDVEWITGSKSGKSELRKDGIIEL